MLRSANNGKIRRRWEEGKPPYAVLACLSFLVLLVLCVKMSNFWKGPSWVDTCSSYGELALEKKEGDISRSWEGFERAQKKAEIAQKLGGGGSSQSLERKLVLCWHCCCAFAYAVRCTYLGRLLVRQSELWFTSLALRNAPYSRVHQFVFFWGDNKTVSPRSWEKKLYYHLYGLDFVVS